MTDNIDNLITKVKNYLATGGKVSSMGTERWEDFGLSLGMCLGDEHDKLTDLEQEVAQMKLAELQKQEKRNVSEAELIVSATDKYKEMRRQKLKVEQVEELIRLIKLRSRRDI